MTDFDFESTHSERIPKIDKEWKTALDFIKNNYSEDTKGIDIHNKAFRTINEIDYEENGLDIKVNFSLQRESQLLIFTRCFVNKDINESFNFDTESVNNGPGEEFNKYTTVIVISKEPDSNKNFISFGTYYEDQGDKSFKIFAKRQLVDYDKIASDRAQPYSLDESKIDTCEFSLFLYDLGKENIQGKIFVNNNTVPNNVSSSFYIPADKRAKFMIAGSGQRVEIKGLEISSISKEGDLSKGPGDGHCQCCIII